MKLTQANGWRRKSEIRGPQSKIPPSGNGGASARANKMTSMLLMISVSTTIVSWPIGLMNAFKNSGTLDAWSTTLERQANIALAMFVCRLLIYTNSVVHFFQYCVSGEKFRQALKRTLRDMLRIVCFRKPEDYERSVSYQTTQSVFSVQGPEKADDMKVFN